MYINIEIRVIDKFYLKHVKYLHYYSPLESHNKIPMCKSFNSRESLVDHIANYRKYILVSCITEEI